MTNNLKKSLFVGLAALSFVSVASATNASAKSYAKVTSNNTLTTDPTTRNFESTGSNALMNKAGTLKGAKTVASKATMSSLANSKKSANYFRAYREATTNRGSKYYKVVSMDKKYRGWIYVGGVKSANTTTEATMPAQTKNYYLANPSKNTIWDAPKYTQYKASKVGLTSFRDDDKFTVDKAVTKTREGSLYYHVTSDRNSKLSGWVYAGNGNDNLGGLTKTAPTADADQYNSVNVRYVDANNNILGTSTYVNQSVSANVDANGNKSSKSVDFGNSDVQKGLGNIVSTKTPANYKVNDGALVSPNTLTYTAASNATSGNSSYATVTGNADVKYGSTITVRAQKVSTSKISFWAQSTNGTPSTKLDASALKDGKFPSLTNAQQSALTTTGDNLVTNNVITNLFADGKALNKLYSAPYQANDGSWKQKVYTYNNINNGNTTVKAGDNVNAYYSVAEVAYNSNNSNNDSGNSNYVG